MFILTRLSFRTRRQSHCEEEKDRYKQERNRFVELLDIQGKSMKNLENMNTNLKNENNKLLDMNRKLSNEKQALINENSHLKKTVQETSQIVQSYQNRLGW